MKIFKSISSKIKENRQRTQDKHQILNLVEFLSAQGVHLMYAAPPSKHKIKGLTPFEIERHDTWVFDVNTISNDIEKYRMIYGQDATPEYLLSIFDGGTVVQGEKRKVLLDFESEFQHIINNRRLTVGQPKVYKNTIYTHGACTWRGTGVEDKETIASYLQSCVNEKYRNSYRVVNSAIGRGSTEKDDIQYIKEQQYQKGDIVVLGSYTGLNMLSKDFFEKHGIAYLSLSDLFHRPHTYGEWFNDHVLHTNKRGNKVIADALFNKLTELEWLSQAEQDDISLRKPPMPSDTSSLTKGEKIYGDNPDLIKFVDSLKQYKKGSGASVNGSIVMNCNPFTLGHRYLIEYAASQVENLYIFVVEENRSYFTFEDRLELVRQGTSDLKNVTVLPSGNFIISATTFPGYFYKDNLKDAKIDCSNDLNVFAQYIAPALNIRIRFAGEEPLDPVTNQYNEGMKEILPQYNMEFRAIPRKEDDEGIGVISASRVRKYFEKGELDKIAKIVPSSTYEYLVKRYKKEHA